MRGATSFVIVALITGAPLTGCAQAEPEGPVVQGYEVVRTYPHDPTAFTQGLIVHDGALIETTGRYPSTLRRVRLEDGSVLQKRELDLAYFGEGVTEIGGRLFGLTWQNGTGFIWDADDFSALGQFTYSGEGWGLTDDGERLILSDGTSVIRFLDPDTFVETGRIDVTLDGNPVTQLNELEWIDGQIVANVWQQDVLVKIDPTSGKVVGIIDLMGLLPHAERLNPNDDVLNGIAWDETNRRLFVTGKNWPKLFEIKPTDTVN